MKNSAISTINLSIRDVEKIERRKDAVFYAVVVFLVALLLVVQFLRNFVFFSVVVSGTSMEKTLVSGDKLAVDRMIAPSRYDVVVFNAYGVDPTVSEDGIIYIKRIIALGGEEIWTENGEIRISYKNGDGETVEKKIDDKNAYYSFEGYELYIPRQTVPEGSVFVLGDNRTVSRDSRSSLGCVPKSKILGVVPDLVIENKDEKLMRFFIGLI